MGESGFKTFLAQQFLEYAKIVTLSKEYLKSIIDSIVLGLSSSLKYSINHFVDKLFDGNQSNSKFRPGLFLSVILECKPLIHKNLSNLPIIILERFNKLFSGKHNLTLNEDIHNIFASQTNKELTDISSNFRDINN